VAFEFIKKLYTLLRRTRILETKREQLHEVSFLYCTLLDVDMGFYFSSFF